MAWRNVEDVLTAMGVRTQNIQDPKTRNILFRPDVLPTGTYRKAPLLPYFATKTRHHLQFTREAKTSEAIVEFDPAMSGPLSAASRQDARDFPYSLSEETRMLVITLDPHAALDSHFRSLMAKAQIRRCILFRVARKSW